MTIKQRMGRILTLIGICLFVMVAASSLAAEMVRGQQPAPTHTRQGLVLPPRPV